MVTTIQGERVEIPHSNGKILDVWESTLKSLGTLDFTKNENRLLILEEVNKRFGKDMALSCCLFFSRDDAGVAEEGKKLYKRYFLLNLS